MVAAAQFWAGRDVDASQKNLKVFHRTRTDKHRCDSWVGEHECGREVGQGDPDVVGELCELVYRG